MGFSSQSGQVLFATQASEGVFPAGFGSAHTAMKLRSGALGPNRDLLVTDPEIGGGRDTTDAYLGASSWSGDYEFYVRLESLPTLLRAVLGEANSVAGTGLNTHTITPVDSATLPYLAIEEKIGSGLETYQYVDAVVNTFHLEAEANGYLMGTAGLIARQQTAGATPTATPDWDDSFLIVGTNIALTYNSVTLPAKSFSLDINNNFEDDDFRLGSFYLGDLTAKSREVNGSFTIRPEDSSFWRQAVYGTPAATAVGGLTTKQELVITCTTYEDIPGSTPLTKSSITITIPSVALEPYGLEPSGDDVIENDVSFRALRPVAANDICTVEVVNARTDIA
ncbi:MAG: major tail protein [Phage AS32]|nr:MAG: major tail protein [Phage AS32]